MKTLIASLLLSVPLSMCAQEIATSHAELPLPAAPDPVEVVRPIPASPKAPSGFWDIAMNRWLTGAEFSVRMADAITTYRDDGSGQCPHCYEKELPAGLAKSAPKMLAYSAAISVGVNLGSRVLWNHGHKRLARAVLVADIVGDGSAVVGNLKAFQALRR